MRAPATLTALILAWASLAPAADWTPAAMMTLKRVADVQPAPDGQRAAFTVAEAVMGADRSEWVSQIHLGDKGGSRAITFGEKSSTHPRWTRSGDRLAFLSSRGGKAQIFVLRLDGGEAEPVTDVKGAISAFAWSPDGTRLAFTMTDPKSEAEEKADKAKDDGRWHEEKPPHARLWIVPALRDAAGRREPRRLLDLDRHVSAFDWAPDGRSLAVLHQATPKVDHWPTLQVQVVDAGTGRTTAGPLAAADGPVKFSPDGTRILFTQSPEGPRWAHHSRLAVLDLRGAGVRPLAPSPDGQPAVLGWSADGARVLFSESRGTRQALYVLAPGQDRAVPLDLGPGLASGFNLDATGTQVGFLIQAPDRAVEAATASLAAPKPLLVSRINAGAAGFGFGRTEVVKWKGADGLEIEGLLTTPQGLQPGTRVPLVLNVHGGPTGVFTEACTATASIYPIAAFAAKGIAVLRPNPRGSSGYGRDFRFANLADWGGKDYQDLMLGVDKVIAMGVADPDRLGVMGWSYGGFMTSWIITQTKRFKAASVGAAVTNLVSFNGTTDIPGFVPDYFGGQSWDRPQAYLDHSPIFHVKGVSTPTLIQHCEGDLRVPISQGYEFYNALKQQGVPVRMLVLPRQTHGPTEPRALLKVMETNLDWFAQGLLK